MDFKDIVQKRRSIRKYTDEKLTDDEVKALLRAALMAPTGHGQRAWHFVVVKDSEMLAALAASKEAGGDFLTSAPLAIVVAYDTAQSDVWIEDASIAAVTIQYQATELGLGSCWSQIRQRTDANGNSASANIRKLLSLPETWEVECVIGVGHPAIERKLQDESKLSWDSVVFN